jgi:hypothetical protein
MRGNENKHFKMPTLAARDGLTGGANNPESRRGAGRSVGIHDVLYYEAKELLPTLTDRGNYNRRGSSVKSGDGLATALKASLPTLTSRDYKSGSTRKSYGNARPLNEVVREEMPTLTANRWSGLQSHGVNAMLGPLNPAWCEWFMGFPVGWTE